MKKLLILIFVLLGSFFIAGCSLGNGGHEAHYIVRFDTGTDEEIPVQEVPNKGKVVKPQDPEKYDYYFNGWYDESKEWDFDNDVVTKDTVLVAKFEVLYLHIICDNDLDIPLSVGQTLRLSFRYFEDETNDFIIESLNPNIAQIDNGILTAKANGKANVKVISKINPKIYKIFTFFVGEYDPNNEIKVIIVNGRIELKVGETEKYTTEIQPESAKNSKIIWSTSDETVLSINEMGVATAKAPTDLVIVYATSAKNDKIIGQKMVSIKDKEIDYPDLNGYPIKLAVSETDVYLRDPHEPSYTKFDKEARMRTWLEIEQDFNCQIELLPYPSNAWRGPARWNYIIEQAKQGVADYDFYLVPDSQIHNLADAGAILDTQEFYNLHGNGSIDPIYLTTSTYKNKLYGLVGDKNNIQNVMYYNIGLLEQLMKYNLTLKEPAQLFLDGEWTYSKFVSYCKEVQDAMRYKFGETATPNSENQQYFAVSGWDTFWYIGLSSNDGDPIANVQNLKINLDSNHRLAAAEVVKEIYTKGYAAKEQKVDHQVTEWNEQRALFNTGDLWFVNKPSRWGPELWSGDTRYGYVPWPMPDDMTLRDYQVALSGTDQYVMAIGRDYSYYGNDCTPENIYWAISEYYQRSNKYYKNDYDYNEERELTLESKLYADSPASQQAYIQIQRFLKEGRGYYDPMMTDENPIGTLFSTSSSDGTPQTIKAAVSAYCASGTYRTWPEAISDVVKNLEEKLIKRYS